MPFADYFAHAVAGRSVSPGRLAGSPAHAYRARSTTCSRSAASCSAPTLVAPRRSPRRRPSSSRASPASCRASAAWSRTTGASTFELRDGKSPHWTGSRNSPRTFGHFGAAARSSGSTPTRAPRAACSPTALRRLGEGGVAALQRRRAGGPRRRRRRADAGARRTSPGRSSRPPRGHRRDGRRARDRHRRRHLAEVIAGTQHAARAEIALADGQHACEDDVEAVVGLSFRGRGPCRARPLRAPSAARAARASRPAARRAARCGRARAGWPSGGARLVLLSYSSSSLAGA